MKEALKGILGSKKARRRGGPSLSICAAESLSWGFLQLPTAGFIHRQRRLQTEPETKGPQGGRGYCPSEKRPNLPRRHPR